MIGRTASTEVPWDTIRIRHGQMLRIDDLFFAPHDILAFKERIATTVGLPARISEPHEWQK